ncbi:3-hydroxybutyryl-CoA dehydrogenase [Ardenticatena maritima]|uniref:3-hydroxybutyryl-CoA dehydrogenase n=1 Tax=Ardenticatena maritima TaxID=872965 RepID=A0A0M8K8P3_9CHLR|nr:3-hydroxyacyl-CoA dehydrogenase family protein [Ardenticatena maritima]GAP62749.1 3-hydroxybutyryl-CoA dehydrogenase [Ardenticatena maritima]
MEHVWVYGDGPLAVAVAEQARQAGFEVDVCYEMPFSRDDMPPYPATKPLVIVEAVIADRARKADVLRHLGRAMTGETLLLSATLNASATEAGMWSGRPERTVGWAALPPLASGVVEGYAGRRTTHAACEAAHAWWARLGKTMVLVGDTAGGVLPRTVAALVNEAAFAVQEQVATPEDIDRAMQLGTNYPHGPLAWGDQIGLDQVLGILEALCIHHDPARYRPAALLRQMVQAGEWGRRTGRGFYTYAEADA